MHLENQTPSWQIQDQGNKDIPVVLELEAPYQRKEWHVVG